MLKAYQTNAHLHRLNLTIANCMYLLEPQWNPMVESQAIARILRLGQTRNVRVVRYIMKATVEEVEPRFLCFIRTD
jgi:SNF2 family DNA or RNA helicase